ncbi:MAG: DUF2788 domain-containing protein [Gammaproteobacteria bacterium]
MDIKQFESISLFLGIGGLILFMAFIIWDLAKKSQAGKFGTLVLFGALGLGVVGFLVKTIIAEYLGA